MFIALSPSLSLTIPLRQERNVIEPGKAHCAPLER